MRIKTPCLALMTVALLWGRDAGQAIPEDPYALLKVIPSFFALYAQKGLDAYSADAVVEGALYESLADMAAQKNLSAPKFMEIYRAEKGFFFKLKNMDYPAFFKQMVDELFTPVRAFDQVIKTIESRRELSWFNRFKASTNVEAKRIQYDESPHIRLVFTAKSGGVIETHTDTVGSQPRVTETLLMSFVINPENRLLKLMKVLQKEKTGGEETDVEKRFFFSYVAINGRTLPSELTIERNGKKEIKFKAIYIIKENYAVFSEKFFGFKAQDGSTGKVSIKYLNYKFNKNADLSLVDEAMSRMMLEQEADAEKLFASAKELIMDGKNDKAKKILQKIVKNYPETTYAKQAQTLLDGLPE